MRVTQTMMTRQYTQRVSGALGDLSYINKQVGSGRKFFKASENPAGAAKAYQLRRQISQVNDYVSNLEDAQSMLENKSSCIDQVKKSLEDAYSSFLGVMNGPNASAEQKEIVAQQLRGIQQTIVKDMNTKYGDKFIFGGSGVSEPPFELSSDGKVLTYKGVDVSGRTDYTWPDGTRSPSMDILDELSMETMYTDLGFGLSFNNGEIVPSSVFDTATPGINVLGYGTDEAGLSNNIVLLLGQMATDLENDCPTEQMDKYLDKFKIEQQNILNSMTKTGSDSMFLKYSQTRLENTQDSLTTKSTNIEYVNAEEAIMNLKTIDYMYQALLKTGQNILSNSFIDFMS